MICGLLTWLAAIVLLMALQERWYRMSGRQRRKVRALLDWAYLCLTLALIVGFVAVCIGA